MADDQRGVLVPVGVLGVNESGDGVGSPQVCEEGLYVNNVAASNYCYTLVCAWWGLEDECVPRFLKGAFEPCFCEEDQVWLVG